MMKRFLPLLFSTLTNIGFAQSDSECCTTARPVQFEVRHTEPRGVGYYGGYTTLEAFLIPTEPLYNFYPYLDFRAHIFNTGRKAFNTGIGARFENNQRIYGGNAYYDYRSSPKRNFNQIAFGLETIGIRWDVYLNGYAVVGDRRSPAYDANFAFFTGHEMIIKQKVQSALSGCDGKVRYHALKKAHYDLFFDLGSYYYTGTYAKNVVGVKAAVGGRITDYIFVEANTSYDREYKWLGQGIFGITYPIGRKNKVRVSACDCNSAMVMRDRMVQMPSRQEIIPVKTKKVLSPAIDPSTGLPYFFVFVNNLSHSAGTYESPYPTLAEAASPNSQPGDIIYVFPGDGTTNGMDQGISLLDRQQLFGSGTVQILNTTLGSISIPALTPNMPTITNSSTPGIVILGNQNTVSGIHLDGAYDNAIYILGQSSATIQNNLITNSNVNGDSHIAGISLNGPGLSGTYLISNNQFIQLETEESSSAVYFKPEGTDVCTVIITGNQISVNDHGFDNNVGGANHLSVSDVIISDNKITSLDASTLNFQPHQQSVLNVWVIKNTISAPSDVGINMQGRDTSITTAYVANNIFTGCSGPGFKYQSGGGTPGSMTAFISGNIFTNNEIDSAGKGDFFSKYSVADTQNIFGTLTDNYAPENGFYIQNAGGAGIFDIQFGPGNVGPITILP